MDEATINYVESYRPEFINWSDVELDYAIKMLEEIKSTNSKITPLQRAEKEFDDELKREYNKYLSLVKSSELYHRVKLDNWSFEEFKDYYLRNEEWLDCFQRFAWDKNSMWCRENNINQ